MRVHSLSWEDPLEEEMATHSSILTWRILWTEESWQAAVHGVTKNELDATEHTCKKKKKAYSNLVQQPQETDISMQRCGRKFS